MKYASEAEIEALVRSFEDATIARDEWKHAEHLIVALYYVNSCDLETATARMRGGIHNLLTKGFNVDLSKEMPYHETLTVFWMRTVLGFNLLSNGIPLAEKARELIARFDKDYPLRFYTRERLFSDVARERYIDPDIAAPDDVSSPNY